MNNNANFLWELNIENVPLGWQDYYELALKDFPNGENMTFSDVTYFCHPVEYRKKLIEKFYKYSTEAKNVYSDNQMPHQEKYNKILKLDISLYTVLLVWITTDYDSSVFDPNDMGDDFDYEFYFENHIFDNVHKAIDDLKFFKFNL